MDNLGAESLKKEKPLWSVCVLVHTHACTFTQQCLDKDGQDLRARKGR